MPIGLLWQTLLEAPLINFLVALSALAFGSFGLAILIFTVITRVVTFPLTLRMLHSMKGMQEINPKIQEIQKKYSDPKRRTEETMKLYREAGVNPLGCLGGQVIQIPLFLALYQVIRITLGGNPEALILLEQRLYDYDFIQSAIPLSAKFLWMDLSAPRNAPLVALVMGSMWLQQRISTSRAASATASAQQQQMTQMMMIYMPFIFGIFAFTAPAGMALYWSATTVIGIVLQWVFVGPGDFTWGSLIPARVRAALGLPAATNSPHHSSSGGATVAASAATEDNQSESRSQDGSSRGGQRGRRRRRGGSGASAARPQPRSGGDRGGQGG